MAHTKEHVFDLPSTARLARLAAVSGNYCRNARGSPQFPRDLTLQSKRR